VFSGTAGVTAALEAAGCLVLPPVDVVVAGRVRHAADICDPTIFQHLLAWAGSGRLRALHWHSLFHV